MESNDSPEIVPGGGTRVLIACVCVCVGGGGGACVSAFDKGLTVTVLVFDALSTAKITS